MRETISASLTAFLAITMLSKQAKIYAYKIYSETNNLTQVLIRSTPLVDVLARQHFFEI